MTTNDADLLDRYAARRDAEAFGQLVDRYQRLVWATCRRRVRAAGDVDDAVQETFLRLARSGPRANLGGWLHRCAANVSADLNRRHATRARHEAAAARPEVDAGASPELIDLREHLDTALDRLDAPQRELIVQRFFAGRTQAEIAAAAGVTPSAVSHRLDRAVDALRQHLAAVGCVTVALVGSLEAEHASAAVPPATTAGLMSIGLGGVPRRRMVRWRAGVVAVATAGLSTVAVWLALDPPARVSRPPTAAAPAVGLTVAGVPGGTTVTPQWKAVPPDGVAAPLAGRVIGTDGRPIAGAVVTAMGPDPATIKTDADGRYAFHKLSAGSYGVGVEAAGHLAVPYFGGGVPSLLVARASRARRDFVLTPGVTVTVRVIDPAGQPVPNAEVFVLVPAGVQAHGQPIFVDGDGAAVLTLPVSASSVTIAVTCVGHAAARTTVTPADADRPQAVAVTLPDGVSVAGVALCGDGKPAAGWTVHYAAAWLGDQARGSEPAVIGAAGAFTLAHVQPGRYDLILYRANDGTRLGGFDLPPAGGGPLRLSIPGPSPGALNTLTGRLRFTGRGGAPDYVDLVASSQSGRGETRMEMVNVRRNGATHGGRGGPGRRAVHRGRPAGRHVPAAAVVPRRLSPQTVDGVRVPGPPVTVTMTAAGPPRLTGTVVGPDGRPVAHFALRVKKTESFPGENYVQDAQWQQVADRGGRFAVDVVGPGVYRAQVSADGYAWAWTTDGRLERGGDTADVRATLSAGGTLAGVVVDGGGRPVAGARVVPLSKAQGVTEWEGTFATDAGAGTTDGGGRFTLDHLAAGTETVRVTAAGFAPLTVGGLAVTEGKSAGAGRLSLDVGGGAEGTVFDPAGRPAPGVVVEFQDDVHYHYEAEDHAAHLLAVATTDGAGHYAVAHLPTVDVTANVPGRDAACVVQRTLHPVDGRTARLDFGGPARVTGRLLARGGSPLAGLDLTLSMGDADFGPVLARAKTDAAGRFAFAGPPAGAFTLFRADDAAFNGAAAVRDVTVTGVGQDLGDVVEDVGAVDITVSADDPADLRNVADVAVERQHWDRWWTQTVGSAGRADAGRPVWRAVDVPAGPMAVAVYLRDRWDTPVRVAFDRPAGAAETAVAVHLPRHLAAAATPPADGLVAVQVRTWTGDGVLVIDPAPPLLTDAAGRVMAAAGRNEQGWDFRLSPGRYAGGSSRRTINVVPAAGNTVQPFDLPLD